MFDELKKLFGILPEKKKPEPETKPTPPKQKPEAAAVTPLSAPEIPEKAAPVPPKTPPKKTGKAKGKKGVRKLDDLTDLATAFGETEPLSEPEPETPPAPLPKAPPRPAPSKPKGRKKAARVDKKGMRVLDETRSLEAMMMAEEEVALPENAKLAPHEHKVLPTVPQEAATASRFTATDKNGLPILRKETDFYESFGKEDDALPPEKRRTRDDDFSRMLHESLGEKSRVRLMSEKGHERPKEPTSLSRQLKRYPAPERTLDLHGYTAIQARLKLEIFMGEAKAAKLLTVRVIMGKGLHSDGPAVLPDVVAEEIRLLVDSGVLLSHTWENGSPENSGSVLLYLRRIP